MHIGSERVEAYAGPENKHLVKEFQGTEYPECGLKWVSLQGGSDGQVSACNAGDPVLIPGLGRSLGSWRRKWQPSPVFSPSESHGQRSLAGYGPRGRGVGHN